MRLPIRILAAAFVLWYAWNWYSSRPLFNIPPGVAVTDLPQQTDTDTAPFHYRNYLMTPLANFSIQARVLSRKDYSFDAFSDFIPTDFAMGWGRMSDPTIYRQFNISQGNRFYFWRWENTLPIPEREVVEYSANMHVIPADDFVKKQIDEVRPGHVIKLYGYLVKVEKDGGLVIQSSLTRSDKGGGACEVIWVQNLSIEG